MSSASIFFAAGYVLGTSFGSADATHFNLPDFRGRVLGAAGQGAGLTARSLGAAVGSEAKALSASEMPAHTHTGTTGAGGAHAHTITDPGHTHTQTTINDDFNSSGTSPPGFAADSAGSRTWSNINAATTGVSVNAAADHTHAFTTGSAGSGAAFGLMQPTLFGGNAFVFAGNAAAA